MHTALAAKQDLGWGWFSLFSEKILWREKMCKSTKKTVKSVLAFHKSSLCFLIGFNSKGNLDLSTALELKY